MHILHQKYDGWYATGNLRLQTTSNPRFYSILRDVKRVGTNADATVIRARKRKACIVELKAKKFR